MRIYARSGVLASLLFLAACGGGDEAATEAERDAAVEAQIEDAFQEALTDEERAAVEDARARAEAALQRGQEFLARNAERDGVITTESGLQYQILSEGPEGGDSPTASDVVEVHYRGVLVDGAEFDSSYARGQPAVFPLGRVIRGWTEGLQLMSEGDRFRFFIPSELPYGETGSRSGAVGPNEVLIFDVELLRVNPGAEEAEEAMNRSRDFLARNAENEDVVVTASGLQYMVLEEGPEGGASPSADDRVRVHYRGTLIDGQEFDSSLGGQPIEFQLSGVIRGWTEGVQLMSEGDKYRFFIPPELAYGARGAGNAIGPNEALIFDVELIEVLDAG
ncbi:MAG: hypothetical protein Tsb0010_10740 [Parvularculaceae bacterium]